MSYGSRAKDRSEALRAAAEISATSPSTNEVFVKLRPSRERLLTVRGVREPAGASTHPSGIFSRLVETGIVAEVNPVFPSAGGAGDLGLSLGGAARDVFRMTIGATPMALAEVAAAPAAPRRAQGLTSLKVASGESATQVARHLQEDPDVEYAYVPAPRHPMVAKRSKAGAKGGKTADPLAARQWSHAAVRIHEARARSGFDDANAVSVAIVDSGVDRQHPDLVDSIEHFINFLPHEGDRDYRGHGTHVAGIVAAEINNAMGIAGLCRARLAVLKALPRRGARWNATAYYQALGKPIELKSRVVNLSLGAPELDPGERDIILDLLDAGVVVVAAMGNEHEEGNPTEYPAAYKGVIAVGATDEADRRAKFSCTGAHVALVAPGERILSTVPRYASEFAATTMYDSWPGTSMATPHVAAAAALLLAKDPGLTPAQVKSRLCKSADKVEWQKKRPDSEYGWGRLNIAKALG